MELYDKFISNIKRINLFNIFLNNVFLIIMVILVFIFNIHVIGKTIICLILIYEFIKTFYNYYKIDRFWKRLSLENRNTLLKELLTLFFEGADYALTENYIIDFKKGKLISFDSIDRVEKNKTKFDEYVKVFINKKSYKYKIGGFSFYLGDSIYYKNLYNYIKFKNKEL